MNNYFMVEIVDDPRKFDYEQMPLFRPQASLELVRGNLMKLCSVSNEERNLKIFQNGILLSEIRVSHGRIISENQLVDKRTNAEKALDFFYEGKRKRTITIASPRVSNDWLLSGHYEEDPNVAKRRQMRVRPLKRNTKKMPG